MVIPFDISGLILGYSGLIKEKTCHKPLQIDTKYPWCVNLCMLVEKENFFQNNFLVVDGKFDFANSVSEMERMLARENSHTAFALQSA